ncbi:MAG: 2-oxoglutarate dehydrogenase E1 component [Endozoicomonadaceae bacterium]|nr:2-oxoglutarate dehydrogenase E1 component [Endozoicomonadaceae bacterium]
MDENTMQQMWRSSCLAGENADYIETLYENYLNDPSSVPEQWCTYFEKLPTTNGSALTDVSHAKIREQFLRLGKQKPSNTTSSSRSPTEHERKQMLVQRLISAFRVRGHQHASLDPLNLTKDKNVRSLSIEHYGLNTADLDDTFHTGTLAGPDEAPLKDIVERLQNTYCKTIGPEFMHIVDTDERQWLQKRIESRSGDFGFTEKQRLHILSKLNAAEGLEKYLAAKYPGTKRFGLEGGESLIPLLDELIYCAGSYGVNEIVIGMAHRGRLNVLVNILGKKPSELFEEFEGRRKATYGSGDVKYHQGFSSDINTAGKTIHLALAFNPSHLEIVNPVVEGSVRARQDKYQDHKREQVIPVVIHGDAAFAGQGVVMETFQMSQTKAYKTGGTIHIIVNNQIGFTTSLPDEARSTEYCTDVAKMIQAPIIHVNGDDPEAVVYAIRLAADFRMTFKKDIIVDLFCYRRLGHNEADEPSGTQPLMYQKIKQQPSTRKLYGEKLIAAGILSEEENEQLSTRFRAALEAGKEVITNLVPTQDRSRYFNWSTYVGKKWTDQQNTQLKLPILQKLGNSLCKIPEGFVLQRQVQKICEDRRKMAAGSLPINWGMGELLAYASLLKKGYSVRLTGQDVGRGTFSHRHAVLHNQKDNSLHVPLAHLGENFPRAEIYNSLLSEEAVLAFEYGYATTVPDCLVIWEAQFGDFANGAQVVIDQFITSGEIKWERLCGLTMLLPHGYEGQGPEHSSARLERYLQLSAQHNVQICLPTTPAQVFHMLRRQMLRPLRKPLIVFSPKSLLRHKLAVSTLEELSEGSFKTVIDEIDSVDSDQIMRIILCSGKVYYDLLEARRAAELNDVAILRIEQLYPFPLDQLEEKLKQYPSVKEVVWCQEEPMNQGAWYCSQHNMRQSLVNIGKSNLKLRYAGRDASAAAACGYMSNHVEEQNKLVAEAIGLKPTK